MKEKGINVSVTVKRGEGRIKTVEGAQITWNKGKEDVDDDYEVKDDITCNFYDVNHKTT